MTGLVQHLRDELVPLHAALVVLLDDIALALELVDGDGDENAHADDLLAGTLRDLFGYVRLGESRIAPLAAAVGVVLVLAVEEVPDYAEDRNGRDE